MGKPSPTRRPPLAKLVPQNRGCAHRRAPRVPGCAARDAAGRSDGSPSLRPAITHGLSSCRWMSRSTAIAGFAKMDHLGAGLGVPAA